MPASTVIVKKVWGHTQDTRCAYCGKTLTQATEVRHTHTSIVGTVKDTEVGLDYCPEHRIGTIERHYAATVGIDVNDIDYMVLPGLHQ